MRKCIKSSLVLISLISGNIFNLKNFAIILLQHLSCIWKSIHLPTIYEMQQTLQTFEGSSNPNIKFMSASHSHGFFMWKTQAIKVLKTH